MQKSEWNGYERLDFEVDGRDSLLICPHEPLPGNPWVWRTEFFGAFDTVDRALLAKGWYIGYHRVSDMYGCQASVEYLRAYQDYVEQAFHLHLRPVLFGFSRGGLYAANYAAEYPSRVGGLYLDAPVLDVRSWPGGYGAAPREGGCWEQCKKWYGLTDVSAPGFAQNPLDKAERLAAAGIPVISVVGLADEVVPYAENMQLFAPRFRNAGGHIEVIEKPGCGHHPHSLEDPAPVVAFIEQYCMSKECKA